MPPEGWEIGWLLSRLRWIIDELLDIEFFRVIRKRIFHTTHGGAPPPFQEPEGHLHTWLLSPTCHSPYKAPRLAFLPVSTSWSSVRMFVGQTTECVTTLCPDATVAVTCGRGVASAGGTGGSLSTADVVGDNCSALQETPPRGSQGCLGLGLHPWRDPA